MNSKPFILAVCLWAFALISFVNADDAGIQRPNIIFLFADDQRADAIGAHGNEPVLKLLPKPIQWTLAESGVARESRREIRYSIPLKTINERSMTGVGSYTSDGSDESVGQDSERQVKVLPVFFVPKGQPKPTRAEAVGLQRHLNWTQRRYREMLNGHSTFEIEGDRPEVYMAQKRLDFYRKQPEGGAPAMVDELLRWKKTDRFSCNRIFLAVMMNPKDKFPKAGGRPFNGGFNTGGGIIKMPSYGLNNTPNFQSTMQHELGHAFGLVHVNVYGYDMKKNNSIMAYNKKHHTYGFNPSTQRGELIPEDYRGLAFNSLVFKSLEFNESEDVPGGYKLAPLRSLKPMTIPNHPMVIVTTNDGETNGSSVQNLIHARIPVSIDRGEVEFDKKQMWHSDKLKTGWATVTLEFPAKATVDRAMVYSQHSGRAHRAVAAQLLTVDSRGKTKLRSRIEMTAQDGELKFDPVSSKVWQLKFKSGKSGKVVIRGVRFYNQDLELFPPLFPVDAEK